MDQMVELSYHTTIYREIITMDNLNYTIGHRKGQHLSSEERHDIEVHLRDGWSIYKIAKNLGRPYNTIKNEIQRGTVLLYNGKTARYKARVGEEKYKENRRSSTRKYRCLETASFLKYVVQSFREKGWSLDACYGHALESGLFRRDEIVCTKTLYNYIDLGLISLKNIDLPEKLRRNTKKDKVREKKKNLGDSIELRDKSIENRDDFGNWEIDSIIGKKAAEEPCIMSLTERKLRVSIWLKLRNHSADAMMEALKQVKEEYGANFAKVFRTITADNGSEFGRLSELKEDGVKVYFAHPYSSWERGTNECHNRMLRRFIPKGKSISEYSIEDIAFFADRINGLPRKILGYKTPEELFEQELDRIYTT